MNDSILRVEAYKSHKYVDKKVYGLDENAILIGSDKIINKQQADLILDVIRNGNNLFFIHNDIEFFYNYIANLNENEQKFFIHINENNRFKYIKTLDFYFYFYDFRTYEFLYDYNVVVMDILNENYNKTKEESVVDFCKTHNILYDKKNLFECIKFYGKTMGMNEEHIKTLYENRILKGSNLVSLVIRFMIEDENFKNKSLARYKSNRNHLSSTITRGDSKASFTNFLELGLK